MLSFWIWLIASKENVSLAKVDINQAISQYAFNPTLSIAHAWLQEV